MRSSSICSRNGSLVLDSGSHLGTPRESGVSALGSALGTSCSPRDSTASVASQAAAVLSSLNASSQSASPRGSGLLGGGASPRASSVGGGSFRLSGLSASLADLAASSPAAAAPAAAELVALLAAAAAAAPAASPPLSPVLGGLSVSPAGVLPLSLSSPPDCGALGAAAAAAATLSLGPLGSPYGSQRVGSPRASCLASVTNLPPTIEGDERSRRSDRTDSGGGGASSQGAQGSQSGGCGGGGIGGGSSGALRVSSPLAAAPAAAAATAPSTAEATAPLAANERSSVGPRRRWSHNKSEASTTAAIPIGRASKAEEQSGGEHHAGRRDRTGEQGVGSQAGCRGRGRRGEWCEAEARLAQLGADANESEVPRVDLSLESELSSCQGLSVIIT